MTLAILFSVKHAVIKWGIHRVSKMVLEISFLSEDMKEKYLELLENRVGRF
ncbi:hypothetical protein [Flavobacterium daejeonense]|uniref:hypothetical protein n=1 Tax=Flavobacterium daejeonense TaxID=350893 RepID=UPI0012DD982A|nr:hypothetical protein [Flavobacterium daejeonense]